MRGHAGALVIVDVASGRVIAAVHQEIAAQAVESPGSTLKPFVLMALLESGGIDSKERLVCHRKLTIGGVPMDCTHPASVKLLDSEEAIAYSCNSYLAAAALRLNSDELVQALRRAGLNERTGLADGEALGHVERPATRDALQLEALGTRGVEVTPLELLEAYRMLALKRRGGDLGKDAPVFSGLVDSVDYGMAHAAYVNGMKVAGKTGTAASRHRAQTHGFFAGYAPADQPEIAMTVYLEQGRGLDAAAVAQPVLAAFAHDGHTQ
jgi:peptidoglycan glycosyltransferase